ncbi:MAG: sulfite exporter TauE/SafE family protein [Candidatus Woesearchaeota archaeon]|jgi:sulfite exporter TauE/SafE/copper chaperone CopZ
MKHQNKIEKSKMKTIQFTAKGTVCTSCEKIIVRQAKKLPGVIDAKFDYKTETGEVTFDENKTSIKEIYKTIKEKGYQCSNCDCDNNENNNSKRDPVTTVLYIIYGIVGIMLLFYFAPSFIDKIPVPDISQNMSLGLLFIVGLLTGFHCVAMCGGFVISYTTKAVAEKTSVVKAHLSYAFGKTLSYTVIGAIFGFIGSVIAFTPFMRGLAGILAGLFLLLFGLKMLNIFPSLRRVGFSSIPGISKIMPKHNSNSSPLVIGLLNGLMIACGPLQAIYILAAGSASAITGAKMLFVFALGTLPVMIGFGFFTSFLSSKFTSKLLKASGILIIIMGILMLNTGLALSGSGYDFKSLSSRIAQNSINDNSNAANNIANKYTSDQMAVQKDGYQEIHMDVTYSGYSPDSFVLKKGIPVHWIINGKQITGCNKGILVPSYNLQFDVKLGEQTIEFTPTKTGTIPWSCWMGMIQANFIVVDDLSDTKAVQTAITTQPAKKASGSCGMGGSGGGCGCGMMS